MKGLVTCTLLCFCIQHFCYHLLLWILTIKYIMKSSMQKFYKILTMHSFWRHKSSKSKHWLCQRWLLKQRMHLGLSCPFCNVPFQLMQPSPLFDTSICSHLVHNAENGWPCNEAFQLPLHGLGLMRFFHSFMSQTLEICICNTHVNNEVDRYFGLCK